MHEFPVRTRQSLLYLPDRAIETATVRVAGVSVSMTVLHAQAPRLEITAFDCYTLGLNPRTLLKEQSIQFLGIPLQLEIVGDTRSFEGSVVLVPRELYLTAPDMQKMGLKPGHLVFAASKGERVTLFGDTVVRLSDTSYFSLPLHEAQAALLESGDRVVVTGTPLESAPQAVELPDRFLRLSRSARPLITETDVRQAILKHKKIWISRNTRLTPAARDLGNEKKIFEFEL